MAKVQASEGLTKSEFGHEPVGLNPACQASATTSWYDRFVAQLVAIIPRFGLDDQRDLIVAAFEMICSESLATATSGPPPDFSRINADGIPLQYSFAAGAFETPLQ